MTSGDAFTFPTTGVDLRWRAVLHSLSPELTPQLTTVNIELDNTAPTDIGLSNAAINSSDGGNAVVGTLSTTDVDSGDAHAYTLVAGTGDTDNGFFNISSATLSANDATAMKAVNSIRIQTDDGNSGTFTKVFLITVNDDTSPVIGGCPANINTFVDAGLAAAAVSWTDPTTADNFDGALTYTSRSHIPGSSFAVGVTAVTYTFTDSAANSSSCNFSVTVIDDKLPVIGSCPANISQATDSGMATAVVSWTTPTATDDVDGVLSPVQTSGLASGSAFPIGVINETFSFTDSAGNAVNCNFRVTVTDSTGAAPVVTSCPANISTVTDAGMTTAIVSWTAPTATDAVDGAITAVLSAGQSSGSTFAVGVTTETFSFTDSESNAAFCTFTITVKNDLDGDGIADDIDPDIDGDGMPNVFETTYGLDPLNAADAAIDSDGDGLTNLDEYLANMDPNVDDNPPVVTAPADISINATGLLTAVALGSATAVDALNGPVAVSSDASSAFAPGQTIVTWTAQDSAGNLGTAQQIVDVHPLANFSIDQTVGEGSNVEI